MAARCEDSHSPTDLLFHLGTRPAKRSRMLVFNSPLRVVVGLALGLLWPSDASAAVELSPPAPASDEIPTRAFATIAAGVSGVGAVGLVAATLEVATVRLTARAFLSGSIDFGVSPTEQIEEYAVLLGKSWQIESRTAYVSAGLGRAKTTRRGKFLYAEDEGFQTKIYEAFNADSLSVPLEAGITWDGSSTSVGLALVANINRELSTVGVVLSLSFGKTQ